MTGEAYRHVAKVPQGCIRASHTGHFGTVGVETRAANAP